MDLQFTKDGIAVLTLNNGQNRLDEHFIKRFPQLLDQVERNSACKALITTGTGKFFSNGLDLEWFMSNSENLAELIRLMKRIVTFPIPTIAAINGHAFAGGAFLALCHDLRVMSSDKGWMCWNEVHVKLKLLDCMHKLIHVKIASGPVRTQAILFGKRFTAREAMSAHLVNEVTTRENLMQYSLSIARRIVGKQGFDRSTLGDLKHGLYADFVNSDLEKIKSLL